MKKVAILGGAFNCVGKHHIDIANHVLNYVDEIWLTPCFLSMTGKILEDAQHRLNMCEIAIKNNNRKEIILCDFEIKNKLHDESCNIIEKFLQEYSNPNTKFYFLIGIDNALSINTWENWEQLIEMISFIVVPRKGYKDDPNITWFRKSPHIFIEDMIPSDSSSTEIRNDLKKLGTCSKIDPDVLKYIKNNGLYCTKN